MFSAFIISVLTLFLVGTNSLHEIWLKKEYQKLGELRLEKNASLPNHYTLQNFHQKDNLYTIANTSKSRLEKETVQKILIRTCNSVYQKALWNHCPNAYSVNSAWSFALTISAKGKLFDVWNQSQSNLFVCGNEAQFGRYLLHNALPVDLAKKYNYDLNGVADLPGRTYPCGYSELVYLP